MVIGILKYIVLNQKYHSNHIVLQLHTDNIMASNKDISNLSSDEDFEIKQVKRKRPNYDELYQFDFDSDDNNGDHNNNTILLRRDSTGDYIISPAQPGQARNDLPVETSSTEEPEEFLGFEADQRPSVSERIINLLVSKITLNANMLAKEVADKVYNRLRPIYDVNNSDSFLHHYENFDTHRNLLLNVTLDSEMALDWLKANEFIAKNGSPCPDCVKHNRKGKLVYYHLKTRNARKKEDLLFKCKGVGNKCNKEVSPFKGTFFDGVSCKIPCHKVIEILYYWAKETRVKDAAREVGVHPNTIVDYFNYCREVCTVSTEKRRDFVIGGVGKIVEIDESKFFKRKYNVGRLSRTLKDGWVFGGICRETKDIFMVRVPNRNRKTLYKIIKKHIRPGTRIISDEWKAYATLEDEGYEHDTICHKRQFVDPQDPSIHTQNIEIQWRYAKAKFPKCSTSKPLRDGYLQEFLYRRKHGERVMDQLLHDIKELYKWNPNWKA